MIRFTCTNCGASFTVKDEMAGKRARCGSCKQPVTIPPAGASRPGGQALQTPAADSPRPPPPPAATSAGITAVCSACGTSRLLPQELCGRTIVCNNCGRSVRVPVRGPGHPVRMDKRYYMIVWLAGNLVAIALFVVPFMVRARRGGARACLLTGAVISLAAGAVTVPLMIYRMWQALQGHRARTKPGHALGFLFLPIYNLYWVFQVYWGWTVDCNRLLASRRLHRLRVPEAIGLALPITILGTTLVFAPFVIFKAGIWFLTPLVILLPAFMSRVCDAVNALADTRDAPQTGSDADATETPRPLPLSPTGWSRITRFDVPGAAIAMGVSAVLFLISAGMKMSRVREQLLGVACFVLPAVAIFLGIWMRNPLVGVLGLQVALTVISVSVFYSSKDLALTITVPTVLGALAGGISGGVTYLVRSAKLKPP